MRIHEPKVFNQNFIIMTFFNVENENLKCTHIWNSFFPQHEHNSTSIKYVFLTKMLDIVELKKE